MQRLVDVLDRRGTVVHTYPVTLEDPSACDEDFEAKALEAAAHGQLVADDLLGELTARMHIDRGGRSDELWARALQQHLSDRAYVLWQQEGSHEGGADANWLRTKEFEAQ